MRKDDTQMPDSDPRLDRILADMAEDVPPVPDDFRQRWRQAVRMEMEASDRFEGKPERTAADAKPAAAAPKKTIHFLRSLQIAAVFLFVLGGVMAAGPSLFLRQGAPVSAGYMNAPSSTGLPQAAEKPLTTSLPEAALRESGAVLSAESGMEEAESQFDAAPDLTGMETPGAGTYVLDAQRGKTVSSGYLKDSLLSAEPASYALRAETAGEETVSPDSEGAKEAADAAVSEDTEEAAEAAASEDTEEAADAASEPENQAETDAASDGGKETADSAVSLLFWQVGGLALMLLSVLLLLLSRRRKRHPST